MAEFGRFVAANRGTFFTLFASYSLLVLVAYGNFAWMAAFFSRSFGWDAPQSGYVYGMIALTFGTSSQMACRSAADRSNRPST